MNGNRHRVLVVDDERSVRELLDVVLTNAGFEVILAESGEAGLQALDTQSPDLVLLDVIMPGMNAWMFIRNLKERSKTPPVIVISAEHASPKALGTLADTVSAFIPKPFSLNALIATCQQVLGSKPAATSSDRRNDPRRQLVVNVTLLSESGQPLASGFTRDLGLCGAQIDLGVPLQLTQEIRLALHLPDYWEPLSLQGRVQWREGVVLGVQFVDPTSDDQRRLSTLLRA
jgi:CheY-like chemotaxis protein